jgi:apolipoprotein N-acyltransferase
MVLKRNSLISICFTLLLLSFFSVQFAFAKPTEQLDKAAIFQLNKVVPKTGIATTDIGVLVGQGIKAALGLVGLIFFGLMVYGGFLWMTARGAEDQAEKAKNTVTTAVIGIAIIVSAYAITAFVTNRLLLGK